jgi:hypothetical protein
MKTLDWQSNVIKAGGWPQLDRNLTLLDPKCVRRRRYDLICHWFGHRETEQIGTTFYTVEREGKEERRDMKLTRACCQRCGQPLSGWRVKEPSAIPKQETLVTPYKVSS